MWETIAYCVTALVCSVIIAGGINRAAFYLSLAVAAAIKREERHHMKRAEPDEDHHDTGDG